MENINGNILITTDWHLGLKNNAKNRLSIVINVVKEIITYIKKNNIQTLIFCGDLFHCRTSIDVNVINIAYKLILALSKCCKVYLICGNHDSYLKNTIDVNSINIFKSIENVKVVDSPIQVSINGNRSILVPWLSDLSNYDNEIFDMMFGHFDVSRNFLIQQYLEQHSKKEITKNAKNVLNNSLETNVSSEINDLKIVGSFVDKVKENGLIFSGHIHSRKELISKSRKFILVGDPYQQNLGEKDYSCGFYVINKNNSYIFNHINNVPKHIDLKISDIVKDIDNFDFSIVKGNIIHKTYDVEISIIDDAKITQKITDWQPYEELLPDYDIQVQLNSQLNLDQESIDSLKKSKMDYIKNYINNIDQKVVDEYNINKDEIFKIIQEHYNKVENNK